MKKNLLHALEALVPPHVPFINQYKRRDIFRCTHETHRGFGSAVSVYHVLKVKQCFPHGCISFQWRCQKLRKGAPCPRNYKHVGRPCASCPSFYDVKVVKKPEVIISEQAFHQFSNDLKSFESWIKRFTGKLVSVSGVINSVKPRYSLRIRSRKPSVIFQGFLLNFRETFIEDAALHDFLYMPVSSAQQHRWRFSRGDVLQCTGTFVVRNGMLLVEQIRAIEVVQRGEPCFWTDSRARVAQRTGTILPFQAEQCYSCDKGILLELVADDEPSGARRKMFCLEGVRNPQWCWYCAQRLLRLDECRSDEP